MEQSCEAIFFALDNPCFFRLDENFHGKIERIPILQMTGDLREPNKLRKNTLDLLMNTVEPR